MRRLLWGVCLLLFVACPASADQAVWLTKDQADDALRALQGQKEIREYCEPCGDTAFTVKEVKDLALITPKDGPYRAVSLDGAEIDVAVVDLAYVYVNVKGAWVNLAKLVGAEVQDVPALLPVMPRPMFTQTEHARLLRASPEYKAANARLDKAWAAVEGLLSPEELKKRLPEQQSWLRGTERAVRSLKIRRKYHQSVPECVLRDGVVDREKALVCLFEARAALLEQYAGGIKGEAALTGVWTDEGMLGGRGLQLDDGLTFVSLCAGMEEEELPELVRALSPGTRLRISGPMIAPDGLRCSKELRVEKLDPLPVKEPEPSKESVAQASVVGVIAVLDGGEEPSVNIGGGEYRAFSLKGEGGKECAEGNLGDLVVVTGSLKTPARGMPFFDPNAPTTCERLRP